MGTHLRVLIESHQSNTNMTGFRWFAEIVVSWTKVISALEGVKVILKRRYNHQVP